MMNVREMDVELADRLGQGRRAELERLAYPIEHGYLDELLEKRTRELEALKSAKAELEAMRPSQRLMRIVGRMTLPELIDVVYSEEKSASRRRKRSGAARHWEALTTNPLVEEITMADVEAFEQKALTIWARSYVTDTLVPIMLAALRKTPYSWRFPQRQKPKEGGADPRSGRIEAVERDFERMSGKRYLVDVAKQYCRMRLADGTESSIRKHHYAVRQFTLYLGHHASVGDFDEGAVAAFVPWLRKVRRLSENSIKSIHSRILVLWRFAWRKGWVTEAPEQKTHKPPRRPPVAWTMDELRKLWRTCESQTGEVFGSNGRLFWLTLHAVAWDTAERIDALLSARFEDISEGWLRIDASRRKGKVADGMWKLHPETLTLLGEFRGDRTGCIWPISTIHTLYRRYDELLQEAGLPHDNSCKFHRLRKSAASHLQARGGNASLFLGHADPSLTASTYIDPRITGGSQASDLLPRLSGQADVAVSKGDLAAAIRELTAAAVKLNAAS